MLVKQNNEHSVDFRATLYKSEFDTDSISPELEMFGTLFIHGDYWHEFY